MTLVKFTRVKIYGGKLTTGKTFYHGVCNGTYIVMHLQHLLCTIFDRKTACNFFQNPVFDLIRRIHKESGFNGFMIRFWICPKKRKIQFWIRKSWFWFSPEKRTVSIEDSEKEVLLLTVGFMLDFLVYLTVTLQWVLLPRLHLKTV